MKMSNCFYFLRGKKISDNVFGYLIKMLALPN